MKPADPSPDRRSSVKDAPSEPGPRTAEAKDSRDFEPKYLDVPWQKRSSSGGRNLILGVLLLIVAIAAVGQGLVLSGTRVLIPVAAALLAVLTLFVLARARILRQRNGGFLGFTVVALLAALIPFLEYAFNRSALSRPASTAEAAPAEKKPADVPRGQPGAQLPQLTQVFQIPSPAANAARFKVVRDLGVEIDGKTYLIKAGEVFAATEQSNDEVRFNAGDQQIALRKNFVEMVSANNTSVAAATPISNGQTPAQQNTATAGGAATATPKPSSAQPEEPDPSKPETPAQITQRAQKEAIRRYPALGQKNSPENQLFVETYQELKHSGADDFFADPQWPLQLAELLAKREKWNRPSQPRQQTAEPAPQADQSPAETEKPEQDEPKQDEPKLDKTAQDLPQGEMDDLPSKQ